MSVIWSWTYFYNLHWNNYLYFKGLLYIWEDDHVALLHMAGLENSECIWKIQRKPEVAVSVSMTEIFTKPRSLTILVQFVRGDPVGDGPFNFQGDGVMFFFLKKYSDSQCCWKKYSDFGGGKKKNMIQFLSYNLMLNSGKKFRASS